MLREEQIDIRRRRAKEGHFTIQNLGRNRVFSDYQVSNPDTGGQYTVQVRGFEVGDNSCTCPDFRSNTLGTCKHIECVLEALRDETPAHLRQRKAAGLLCGSLHILRHTNATLALTNGVPVHVVAARSAIGPRPSCASMRTCCRRTTSSRRRRWPVCSRVGGPLASGAQTRMATRRF